MTSFTLVHGNSPTMLGSINGLGIDGVFESPVGPESREKETCWDIGIDGVFESPVGPENTDIEAFYGYDISIKKHCVSYEGNGGLGVYEWLEVAELYEVSRRWIKLSKLQGMPKKVKTFDGIRRYRALLGDNPTDLRCLLNALTVAFPELTTRLSEMDPVPLAHLGTLSHAEAWPVMICQAVYAPKEVQAGEYLVSTSPAHCEFMQFDHTTPLSDVYMCARVVQRRKTAKTGAKLMKKQRQRELKRQKMQSE